MSTIVLLLGRAVHRRGSPLAGFVPCTFFSRWCRHFSTTPPKVIKAGRGRYFRWKGGSCRPFVPFASRPISCPGTRRPPPRQGSF